MTRRFLRRGSAALAGAALLAAAPFATTSASAVTSNPPVITAYLTSAAGALVMIGALAVPTGWAARGVLAAGQLLHGWAMGLSNSHEMSYRQALTPDALQARTNTTMRSLNRAVVVVVSPLAGLLVVRAGYGGSLAVVAAVFALSGVLLLTSPFRRARTP